MLPETASAPAAEPPARDYLAEYARHQWLTGRGNSADHPGGQDLHAALANPQDWAAQPLATRLAEGPQTNSFLIFLMVHGWLQPGYDYLVARKLSSFWREIVPAVRWPPTWSASAKEPRRSGSPRSKPAHGLPVHRSSAHRDQRAASSS